VVTESGARSPREQTLIELLVRAIRSLRQNGFGLESATGLSGRELDLVAILSASGSTSVKSLVADLRLPRSTMTAIVDRLQERGLVRRRPNPSDRRSVILDATPAATEVLAQHREDVSELAGHIAHTLDLDEQDELIALVGRLIEAL